MINLYKQATTELVEHNSEDVFKDCVCSRVGSIASNMTFENQYVQKYMDELCVHNNIKNLCGTVTKVSNANKRTECLMLILMKNTVEVEHE